MRCPLTNVGVFQHATDPGLSLQLLKICVRYSTCVKQQYVGAGEVLQGSEFIPLEVSLRVLIILAAKSVLVFRCVAFFTMLNAPLNGARVGGGKRDDGRGKERGWEGERGREGGVTIACCL